MTLVKCNRAGALDCCATCDHAEPHERERYGVRSRGGPGFCTEWGRCYAQTGPVLAVKVRCVRVEVSK